MSSPEHSIYPILSLADFGDIVKRLRQERCLKQSDLADMSGSSRSWLCNVEQGKHKVTLERAARLIVPLESQLAVVVNTQNALSGCYLGFDPQAPEW